MENLTLNVFLGVFSGILTSIIIFFSIKVFQKIILPWYENLIYRGLDISGEWRENHNYREILVQDSKITIIQNAHKVNGKINLIKRSNNNEKIIDIKNFKFSGEFYDNYLNITCWNEDRRQIGTHNYLLKIERDGKEMSGFKTYFDIGYRKIESTEVNWFREKENETFL